MWWLHAGRLDCQDSGEEAEDQEHGQPDHEPDPDDGDGNLAHRCVHAGETPMVVLLFRRDEGFGWESGPGQCPDSRCKYRTDVL